MTAEISGGEYFLLRTSTHASPLSAFTTVYGTRVISAATSPCFRPMNRLIEDTVLSGLVTL